MKTVLFKRLAALLLICTAVPVLAEEELVIYVYKDGRVATDIFVQVDEGERKPLSDAGSATFDLSGGGHSVQITRESKKLHSFRLNTAAGQYSDVSVQLVSGDETRVNIESYFKTESAIERANAPRGVLSGMVSAGDKPLAGALIYVRGLDRSTESDANGLYELWLPRGFYEIDINHPDYGVSQISGLRVVANVLKGANFSIGTSFEDDASASVVEEVLVMSSYKPSDFEESERYSVNVIDTIGIEQLSRFGDADVAGSVIRLPSITVQDSKFIFIRGLGGRYITTTLNGATLPSTDPSKRTVPLDLFPSNIVGQLDIKKTFIASMPGASTGGNLVINTRSFPQESAAKFSLSLGYVDGLSGESVWSDPSHDNMDLLGWDDGGREEPIEITAIAAALEQDDYFSEDVERQLGRTAGLLMKDDFDLDERKAKPNINMGFNYGNLYNLDSIDGELGFFSAINYKNSWSQKDSGISRTYGGKNASEILDNFRFEEHSNNIDVSGLLSLGLNVGNSSYKANTIVSRVTESKAKRSEGHDGDALEQSVRYSIEWVERQFIAQQFGGEHYLDDNGDFLVDWQFTASQAKREAPDRREAQFNLRDDASGIYNLEVPNLLRRYDELTDDNLDASANFNYRFSHGSIESQLSFGAQTISRERDSDSASYGFRGGQTVQGINAAPNLRVSDVLTEQSITGDTATGYTFQNKTLASDSYDAELDLDSAYLSYDALMNSNYQLVLGLRYEDYQQSTQTFSLQGAQQSVRSEIDDAIALPAVSFNWYFNDTQQIRFAVSKTVSRPDFKETSNATFYDTEFDFRVRGNPLLEVSEVMNFDVRWETYWSDTETLSVALFYKDLEDPIERVVQAASGTAGNSRTFQNSDSAEISGIEFDGRKDFPLDDSLAEIFFVALNASFIDSEVKLVNAEKRELQGQPDYTFNLILGYDDMTRNQEFTVLLNQAGESIKDVGVSGQPDVIQEPRLDLKLNYKYFLSEDFVFKAKVSNLLDSEVEFTQGGRVFQSYKKGMEFQAGFEWNF